jgi:hypothetical protein
VLKLLALGVVLATLAACATPPTTPGPTTARLTKRVPLPAARRVSRLPRAELDSPLIRWPTPAEPGLAILSGRWPRHTGAIAFRLEVTTDGRGGREVLLHEACSERAFAGSVVLAELSWSSGGRPDLTICWPNGRNGPVVSDVDLLASDPTAQWAVRALFGLLSSLGHPPELEERITAMVDAVRAGATSRVAAGRLLGRVNQWGFPQSDYKRDISAAGGWEAIKRRAGMK